MNHQFSVFDMLEPLNSFEENLKHGSGFEGGKIRIYAAAIYLSEVQFADFLKEEYGIGGRSIPDGFMDYNSGGICIRTRNNDELYNWRQVSKTVKKLIATDKYLTDKEKERIKEIQSMHGGEIPMPYPRLRFE